jgi:hypothetical protein
VQIYYAIFILAFEHVVSWNFCYFLFVNLDYFLIFLPHFFDHNNVIEIDFTFIFNYNYVFILIWLNYFSQEFFTQ